MTSDVFKRLSINDEVYVPADDDDLTYRVLDKKMLMGQIQMQKIVYRILRSEFFGEEYETFSDAVQAIEDYNEHEGLCEADESDIDEDLAGEPFWMHYNDVEIDY